MIGWNRSGPFPSRWRTPSTEKNRPLEWTRFPVPASKPHWPSSEKGTRSTVKRVFRCRSANHRNTPESPAVPARADRVKSPPTSSQGLCAIPPITARPTRDRTCTSQLLQRLTQRVDDLLLVIVGQRREHRQGEDLVRQALGDGQRAFFVAEVGETRHGVYGPLVADDELNAVRLEGLDDLVPPRMAHDVNKVHVIASEGSHRRHEYRDR